MSARLDDVLDTFAMEDKPSRETLVAYLKQYPQFTAELTDLFHEIELVRLEMEHEQVDLRAAPPVSSSSQPIALDLGGALSGEKLKALAKALGLSRSLVTAIRDGIILIETIPAALLGAMADFIGIDVGQLKDGIGSSSTTGAALAFKSDEKPDSMPEQISFEVYLEQSSLDLKGREALMVRYGRD
tara:strand:- start:4485 stop:5042 length:558 start_codon:yes stop_codon:yes gene_type:complete